MTGKELSDGEPQPEQQPEQAAARGRLAAAMHEFWLWIRGEVELRHSPEMEAILARFHAKDPLVLDLCSSWYSSAHGTIDRRPETPPLHVLAGGLTGCKVSALVLENDTQRIVAANHFLPRSNDNGVLYDALKAAGLTYKSYGQRVRQSLWALLGGSLPAPPDLRACALVLHMRGDPSSAGAQTMEDLHGFGLRGEHIHRRRYKSPRDYRGGTIVDSGLALVTVPPTGPVTYRGWFGEGEMELKPL